jgi:hypothetical protein
MLSSRRTSLSSDRDFSPNNEAHAKLCVPDSLISLIVLSTADVFPEPHGPLREMTTVS